MTLQEILDFKIEDANDISLMTWTKHVKNELKDSSDLTDDDKSSINKNIKRIELFGVNNEQSQHAFYVIKHILEGNHESNDLDDESDNRLLQDYIRALSFANTSEDFVKPMDLEQVAHELDEKFENLGLKKLCKKVKESIKD